MKKKTTLLISIFSACLFLCLIFSATIFFLQTKIAPQKTTSTKNQTEQSPKNPDVKILAKSVLVEEDITTTKDNQKIANENSLGFRLEFSVKNNSSTKQSLPEKINVKVVHKYSKDEPVSSKIRLINFEKTTLNPGEETKAEVSTCSDYNIHDVFGTITICSPGYSSYGTVMNGSPTTNISIFYFDTHSEVELPRFNGLTPQEAAQKNTCDDLGLTADKNGDFLVKIGEGEDAEIRKFNIKDYGCE